MHIAHLIFPFSPPARTHTFLSSSPPSPSKVPEIERVVQAHQQANRDFHPSFLPQHPPPPALTCFCLASTYSPWRKYQPNRRACKIAPASLQKHTCAHMPTSTFLHTYLPLCMPARRLTAAPAILKHTVRGKQLQCGVSSQALCELLAGRINDLGGPDWAHRP